MTRKHEAVEPHEIFEALSDPQRAAISKALRRKGEMSFTELMKTIDVQSGRLAFQLSKLTPLIEKTEEKYRLSPLGHGSLQIFDIAETLLRTPDEREYRKGLLVKRANPDDAEATAEVTWSWVERWYKTKMGKVCEASPNELTPEEIEAQAGSHSVPEHLRESIRNAPKQKGAIYVVTVERKVVGFIDFPFGCIDEPKPWGRRLFGLINIHREYATAEVVGVLVQSAVEAGRGFHASCVELLPLVYAPRLIEPMEEAMRKLPGVKRVDYSYLRAHVDEIPSDHVATVRNGTGDTLLFRRLVRNRSVTWANQFSHSALKDYPVEPEKGLMLITAGEKICALLFYDELIPGEASLELYPEPEDWSDKHFIQDATKAGANVAKKQGYRKVEIIVEKVSEPWFRELGFKEWEPQTEYEQLTGKSHEGRFWKKGPNYLLKVQGSTRVN